MKLQLPNWISRALLLLAAALPAFANDVPTVGVEGQLEVQLPGTLLKAMPPDRDAPLAVRIASALPRGSTTRYDLRYIGFVAGEYDLRSYLTREDGSATADLPSMPVKIVAILPPAHQGQLAAHATEALPSLGGYRWMMYGLLGAWAIAAVPLFLSRKKPAPTLDLASAAAPVSLAEQLRPLAELAIAGKLSADEKARFERMLLGHWRDRLGLDGLPPQEAIAKLRADGEGGALLRALEDWLHRPPGTATVNLDAVLAPYSRAPAPLAAA